MKNADPDQTYLDRIQRLQGETERISAQISILNADRVRVQKIGIEVDRLWDLVRQRRALREYGRNANVARMRPARIVEGYQG